MEQALVSAPDIHLGGLSFPESLDDFCEDVSMIRVRDYLADDDDARRVEGMLADAFVAAFGYDDFQLERTAERLYSALTVALRCVDEMLASFASGGSGTRRQAEDVRAFRDEWLMPACYLAARFHVTAINERQLNLHYPLHFLSEALSSLQDTTECAKANWMGVGDECLRTLYQAAGKCTQAAIDVKELAQKSPRIEGNLDSVRMHVSTVIESVITAMEGLFEAECTQETLVAAVNHCTKLKELIVICQDVLSPLDPGISAELAGWRNQLGVVSQNAHKRLQRTAKTDYTAKNRALLIQARDEAARTGFIQYVGWSTAGHRVRLFKGSPESWAGWRQGETFIIIEPRSQAPVAEFPVEFRPEIIRELLRDTGLTPKV